MSADQCPTLVVDVQQAFAGWRWRVTAIGVGSGPWTYAPLRAIAVTRACRAATRIADAVNECAAS